MSFENVAKNDLMHCKALARAEKVKQDMRTRYLVGTDGSCMPIGYFDTKQEALDFISESIRYDRYLYDLYDDDCIVCDYWIIEVEEKLVSYIIERK